MKYLLDTNICIHFFRGKYDLQKKFLAKESGSITISEITLAELIYGAENSANPKKNHLIIDKFLEQIPVLPIFDCLLIYGKEKSRLRKSGTLISDFDLLIGCTAVKHELIMVSENTREFGRIKSIKLENWIDRNKDG